MYIREALWHGACDTMGQVNLKHLLWQLREQQSALSDVTLLRQEVDAPCQLSTAHLSSFRFTFSKDEIDELLEEAEIS